MNKPDKQMEPRQYHRSYAKLGVIAQAGRLIQVRAPDGAASDWPRLWLSPETAKYLMLWLPDAIAEAERAAAE